MLDMSQTDVANALGLTFQQVQKYENGTNRVSASRLQHLCEILGVPVSFFFDGAPGALEPLHSPDADWKPSTIENFLATKDGLALAKAFTSVLDLKVRRAVVALVEQIVAEPDGTMH
jgi:transcriptional regulator with XRE-family HTH domain